MNSNHNTPPIPHDSQELTNGCSLRTRLDYTFFPREYINQQYPKFLNPSEVSVKGLIYSVKYLPRTKVWFAKGLIAPVEIHPQLPLIAKMNQKQYSIDLSRAYPRTQAGLFSVGSLDTGCVETVQVLEEGKSSTANRRDAIAIIDALGRRLAAATIEVMDGVLEDRFKTTEPTLNLTSKDPIDDTLPPAIHKITSTYNRLR